MEGPYEIWVENLERILIIRTLFQISFVCLILLISCDNSNSNNKVIIDREKINQKEAGKETINKNKHPTHRITSLDKTEFISYPSWLDSIYPETVKVEDYMINNTIVDFERLNDTISSTVIMTNTGICIYYSLAVFYENFELMSAMLSEQCDHDLSYGFYEYSEFVKVDSLYQITTYFESIQDSFMDENNLIISGCTMDEYAISQDSFTHVLYVKNSGEIANFVSKEF